MACSEEPEHQRRTRLLCSKVTYTALSLDGVPGIQVYTGNSLFADPGRVLRG